MHTTIIRSCASLFTLLVIGYEGDLSSNSSYTITLSKSFREYEVLKQLMQYATYLSSFVESSMSSSKSPNPSSEEKEILEVIKSVFNLLHAIVDTNDPEKSSIYVGSEDPVYEIWLASMQVLGACVRISSHYFNDLGGDNLGTGFLDVSIKFLRVYRIPLLVCLKTCVYPSKMTRFALREAKVLLAMVANRCRR